MNVTQEKVNKSSGILKVPISLKDYKDKVDESIKGYRKKVNLPGFRAGMVPVSLIKKKYGLSIKIEEINKLLSEKVNQFLKDENPSIMGYPLPKKTDLDWEKDDDYIFEYELGYRPEFKISFPKKDEIIYYSIKASKKQIDETIEDLRKQHGQPSFPEDIQENDMLYVQLDEIEEKGIEKKLNSNNSSILIDKLLNESFKKKLLKCKKGDSLKIAIKKVFSNETELTSLLGVKKEDLISLNENFSCKIESIKRVSPSDLNEDFFKKCFPDDKVKTYKEFRQLLINKFENIYEKQSENKFFKDVLDYVIEKTKIDLPDDFLKRWIVTNSEGKKALSDIENEYDLYKKSFSWELVKDKIILDQKIELSEEVIFSRAKDIFNLQLQQYGMSKNDKELDDLTNNLLQNKDERRKMIEQIISEEMIIFFKNTIKTKDQDVTLDEFTKLVS